MFDDRASFLSRPYLQSMLDFEFRAYLDEGRDSVVLARLRDWQARNTSMTETQAESAFISVFFVGLWGHGQSGEGRVEDHTIVPKYGVTGAGASGKAGAADMALGWFRGGNEAVPQVLCEFKDIRSDLEAKQNRKGANQTPIEQCLNYVKGARRHTWGNEPVQPWWGLVTDMNEFRLYWWDRAPQSFMRFKISGKKDLFDTHDLLSDGADAQFDRFLFAKLLHRDMLIAESGKPALWRLVERQGRREIEIEEEFYARYKAVRERLFNVLRTHNRDFKGTPTDLLRVSQKLLDRFIFAFYCEDMGQRMLFPPQFVKEYLEARSVENYYDTSGTEIWEFFRKFFKVMNTGGKIGRQDVPFINGGLFADDALIESLHIPNAIFADIGQGANDASLEKDRDTLLYLSKRYNYAAKGDARDSLTLYTLGRIFEQSITELEYRVGEIEGRETVAKLSKRKRDGVYYTPEWVVDYLVNETMGPWFKTARIASAWNEDDVEPSAEALKTYLAKLRAVKVVDPACGSGAFLITAFRRLLKERQLVAALMQRRALKDDSGIGDDETRIVADILRHNLHGVDINPASVEIAKLALWLHSARANAPLSTLDDNIRCGNSLVASDCWSMIAKTPEAEARINPFDWEMGFRDVMAAGGFDIVLGNPPYVKLQNLMKVDPDVVNYLRAERPVGTYESTQTGNFDLYLPFIEKGLRLLSPGGRMAYIAPSLWTVNEYGAGLRRLLHRTRQLERWLDFKSFQVFKEAITYTALQFFTRHANEAVSVVNSAMGEIGSIIWTAEDNSVSYTALGSGEEWVMLSGEERNVVVRLAEVCDKLGSSQLTESIFQGVVTSHDSIYHLVKVGPNKYVCSYREGQDIEFTIEDSMMKPLISGPQAKRYVVPQEDKHLLFPYIDQSSGGRELISQKILSQQFPHALGYFKTFEKELRSRESPKMDVDDGWWGYVYPKNLLSHDRPKLIVAQTVPNMRVSADFEGSKYLNNVRVNGIIAARGVDIAFLLGALNGSVADFVFRRIAKPKDGGWFEANKQFIAPLPIPKATPKQQAAIGKRARLLQDQWTSRRDLIAEVETRLSILPRATYKPKLLWPDLPDLKALAQEMPRSVKESERTDWAKARLKELEEGKLNALQGFLDSRAELTAEFNKGELRLLAGGKPVLHRIFLADDKGLLAQHYWRYVLSQRQKDAKGFAAQLGRYPSPDHSDAARQFIARVDALLDLTEKILSREDEMNEALYDLYGLSTTERRLIEEDCAKRPLL